LRSGSSARTVPSAISSASSIPVKTLVIDPISNEVSASTGLPSPLSPSPALWIVPRSITATASPR
jgi:hypothetical protein